MIQTLPVTDQDWFQGITNYAQIMLNFSLTLAGECVESLLDCDDCDGLKRHQLDVLYAHRRLQTINRRGSTVSREKVWQNPITMVVTCAPIGKILHHVNWRKFIHLSWWNEIKSLQFQLKSYKVQLSLDTILPRGTFLNINELFSSRENLKYQANQTQNY